MSLGNFIKSYVRRTVNRNSIFDEYFIIICSINQAADQKIPRKAVYWSISRIFEVLMFSMSRKSLQKFRYTDIRMKYFHWNYKETMNLQYRKGVRIYLQLILTHTMLTCIY